jgi:hypothetical protein
VAHSLGTRFADLVARTEWTGLTKAYVRAELFPLARQWTPADGTQPIQVLADGLAGLLEQELPDARVCIILDEFEVLWNGLEVFDGTIDLLRALRGLAQDTRRLTFMLAGVNAGPSERSTLQGLDNPVYGELSPLYLGPFEPDETRTLIAGVGARMGLVWPPEALDLLAGQAGGHPFLTRLAAGDIFDRYRDARRPAVVSTRTLEEVLTAFPRKHYSDIKQMLDGLTRFYPDEAEVLKLIIETDDVNEYTDFPVSLSHLVSYGLLDPLTIRIRLPLLERWFNEFGTTDL